MRKLNVRFGLMLIGILGALAAGLYLVYLFQQDRIADAQLWQARNTQQNGQFDKAASHYERYLEFKPEDSSVMLAYGEMIEQQMEKSPLGARNPRKVVYLFEEALKREPSREDLRRRLVKLYMLPRMRRYKDAESHLDQLQRNYPEDGQLWQQRAVCQEFTGQYEAAAESLRKATLYPPDQVRSHELLAGLLRKHLNRPQAADETLAAMMTKHADSFEAYLARARHRIDFTLGDISDDAARAYELAPNNAEAILLQARVLQQQNKVADAVAMLERGQQLFIGDARFYRHLAWIDYFQKRHESARERLQAGIVNCPDSYELQTALAELLIQGKMFDQVQKIMVELKAKGVREDRIAYLNARIAVEREQWTEAIAMLEKMRPDARSNHDLSVQLNLLLAHCHRQIGDNQRQLESLQRVLEIDTQSIQARIGIATIYAAQDRLNEAIREYEQLVNLPGAPDTAAVDMVRLAIQRKQRTPGDRPGWPELGQLIAAVEKRYPNSVELLLAKGDFLAAQGQLNDAVALLAAACEKRNEARVWIHTAHLSEQLDQGGIKTIDAAVKKIGDLPELRLKRAAILVSRSAVAARRELQFLEMTPTSYKPEQRTFLLTGLAELYFTIHDYPNARRVFRQLSAEKPSDLHSRRMLCEIALRENDRDALPGLLAEIRKIEPPGGSLLPMLEARHLLALAEEGDRDAAAKARILLQTLDQQRPNWPLIDQGFGRLAEAEGDNKSAIDHYTKAVKLGDAELRTYHRLIRLLVEAKREKEAEEVLTSARKQGAMPLDRQRSVLNSVSHLLKTKSVQDFVRQSVNRDAVESSEQLWLGKMLWDTGDRAKAIETFEGVVKRAGHVPENWVTLVRAYVADNKPDKAQALTLEAGKQLPPELARRTVASCLEEMRQYEAALSEYTAALREQPNDPLLLRRSVKLMISLGKHSAALALLEGVAAKPSAMAKEDIAWARRNLAILGAADRKPEQYERANQLLSQNEAELGANIEDMRARVVLLTQQPPRSGENPTPRKRAIEMLEKIVQHAQAGREDRMVLAKLYDSERQWDKAEKHYRVLIENDPRNPMPLAHFTRRLLQLNKLPDAAEALRKLERLTPASPLVVNLRSRWEFQSGETERLLANLTSYCKSERDATEAGARAFLAASLLDEFVRSLSNPRPQSRMALREAAMSFYERSIRVRPEAVVRIASLWTHTGERDRAIQWLRDPRMKIPLNLRASAEIAILRASHASDPDCREVEKWIKSEAASHPEITLDLHLADIAELRHDFAAAERLYRKILSHDAANLVAMNNLAWVLANRGPSDEALGLIQKVITTLGPIPDLLDTRAKVYLSLSRPTEAMQDLEDAINEAPSAMRYFQLAVAYEQCGNANGSKEAIRSAVQLGFDSRDLHPNDLLMYERLQRPHSN